MTESVPRVSNHLAVIRKRQGISASALANAVAISRQTVYAMEAGTYVPNTAVGLRLARALGVTVEDLFSLTGETLAQEAKSERATLIPGSNPVGKGEGVQLCKVNGKLLAVPAVTASWCLPPSDAVIDQSESGRGLKVHRHDRDATLDNRILLAGCDPAMSLLAQYLRPAGIELILLHRNSSESLSLLKSGFVHLAGTHIKDDASGESNLAAIRQHFRGGSVAVVSFAMSEEGLITARQNPKHIKGIQDLVRKDLRFVNREKGSGSRALLDSHLKRLQVNSASIAGYRSAAPGHLAATAEVNAGLADCCLATLSAARAFGLHFVPLETVRYDLVLRKGSLNLPAIQVLLDVMNRSGFRRALNSAGGYDTAVSGTRVH